MNNTVNLILVIIALSVAAIYFGFDKADIMEMITASMNVFKF